MSSISTNVTVIANLQEHFCQVSNSSNTSFWKTLQGAEVRNCRASLADVMYKSWDAKIHFSFRFLWGTLRKTQKDSKYNAGHVASSALVDWQARARGHPAVSQKALHMYLGNWIVSLGWPKVPSSQVVLTSASCICFGRNTRTWTEN